MVYALLQGDARHLPLADGSVQCCVTSPPYWGLRDYNEKNQIGMEVRLEDYTAALVQVFSEVKRVVRDDGTLWLNIGDSYGSGNRVGHGTRVGYKQQTNRGMNGTQDPPRAPQPAWLREKNLLGVPWRVALALQANGWILRNAVIWQKPNQFPESVKDRFTRSYEHVFLFSKQPHYYFDQEALREPHQADSVARTRRGRSPTHKYAEGGPGHHTLTMDVTGGCHPQGRNGRDVWTISTQASGLDHYGTFPLEIPRRCILAGTSAQGACVGCGAPVVQRMERTTIPDPRAKGSRFDTGKTGVNGQGRVQPGERYLRQPGAWAPSCPCNVGVRPCVVLDCFCGVGTTALAAWHLGRSCVSLDLSGVYLQQAQARLDRETRQLPLLPIGQEVTS
jgi:DNA modification methylase